jgi:CubicO group peptidase (beta-lactamase class C family)
MGVHIRRSTLAHSNNFLTKRSRGGLAGSHRCRRLSSRCEAGRALPTKNIGELVGSRGRLLAYDGMWEGRQLIPRQWILDATTVRPGNSYLAAGVATPYDGYGYQVWMQSGAERICVLKGLRGQMVLIAPASKLVMVHTAVRQKPNDPANAETRALWDAVVRELGK